MSNALLEDNQSQSAADEHWSVLEAQKNGRPLIVRYRGERPNDIVPTDYPFLLSATWGYQTANPAGLPSEQDQELMSRFEDALESALESSGSAHLMVVLTGNGERDWLWYSRGEEDSMRLVNQALKGHKPYPVQFSVQRDPKWRAYTQFQPGSDTSAHAGGLLGMVQRAIARLLSR
jgi:hypothetical protein